MAVLVATALALGGGRAWQFTYGNAAWRIQRTFAGAEPFLDTNTRSVRAISDFILTPDTSPAPNRSQFLRLAVPNYLGVGEPIGFELADSPEALDLQQRFSQLSHLRLIKVHFTRCRITNLCQTATPGFPGIVVFNNCDFSQLPQNQRAQLQPCFPTNQATTTLFCIGSR